MFVRHDNAVVPRFIAPFTRFGPRKKRFSGSVGLMANDFEKRKLGGALEIHMKNFPSLQKFFRGTNMEMFPSGLLVQENNFHTYNNGLADTETKLLRG